MPSYFFYLRTFSDPISVTFGSLLLPSFTRSVLHHLLPTPYVVWPEVRRWWVSEAREEPEERREQRRKGWREEGCGWGGMSCLTVSPFHTPCRPPHPPFFPVPSVVLSSHFPRHFAPRSFTSSPRKGTSPNGVSDKWPDEEVIRAASKVRRQPRYNIWILDLVHAIFILLAKDWRREM